MSDKAENSSSNRNQGRPATAEEQEQLNEILTMLRQQNLNVTSIPLNQDSSTNNSTAAESSSQAAVGATTAGNIIADHATAAASAGDSDSIGRKKHAFWDTQPMFIKNPTNNATDNNGNTSNIQLHAPLIPDKTKDQLRQDPYNMPKGFIWSDLDINSNSSHLNDLYDLLAKNYVEDDDCMFRFDYSTEFLKWALTPPHYSSVFHLGVRSEKSKKLVAFISAIPASIQVYEATKKVVEINFLCVHKKLRSKRLAPVLIKEITRRVNHTGVFQALYTAGVELPGPISSCRYHHRNMNPQKLVDVGFTRIPPRMTMARMRKLYKIPAQTKTPNLQPMKEEDVVSAHALLNNHLQQFKLHTKFSVDEFKHWFLPRPNVITTYVANNDPSDPSKITDMLSFYHLHSSVIGNPKHTHLYAAYSYYNVATSVPIVDLMRDSLTLARKEGIDVFNALEQMENGKFLGDLKFGKGDGNLQYYLYNWCCPTLYQKDVGVVLL